MTWDVRVFTLQAEPEPADPTSLTSVGINAGWEGQFTDLQHDQLTKLLIAGWEPFATNTLQLGDVVLWFRRPTPSGRDPSFRSGFSDEHYL